VAYLGIFVSWIWFPIFDLFYSAFGASRVSAETLASITYLILCLMAGFGYAIRRERKKNKGGVAASSGAHPTMPPGRAPQRLPMAIPSRAIPSRLPLGAPPGRLRIIGNSLSLKYHTSVCPWSAGIFGVNERTFHSTEEAEAEGFRRCRQCLP